LVLVKCVSLEFDMKQNAFATSDAVAFRRRSPLKLIGAAVAFGLALSSLFPQAMAQDSASQSPAGVFAVVYERGPAYQDGKHITEQTNIPDHIKYTESLGDSLIGGGLLGTLTDDKVVGMIIFEAANLDAAKQWLAQDPGVAAGTLAANVRQWQVNSIRSYEKK
jgi:uncharacterized protein YciI